MSVVAWLGGVKKSIYEETLERRRVLEAEVSLKEKELANLRAENSRMKSLYNEVLQERDSLEERMGSDNRGLSNLKEQNSTLEIRKR